MKRHTRTHKTAALACALALLAACGTTRTGGDGSNATPPAGDALAGFRVETVASGLEVPWSIVFAPDGRMLFTERPGRVRVYQNGRLRPEPLITLVDVEQGGETA